MQDSVDRIQNLIIAPDERDRQQRIGPSALGTQCEVCLAKLMSDGEKEWAFNHYAWVGTAVHLWLEKAETDPNILTEQRVEVGEIEGYGVLKGTLDRYDSYSKMAIDYKTTSLKRLRTLSKGYVEHRDGTVEIFEPQLLEYYVQVNGYGLGAAKQGLDVERVGLYFIPRDASSVTQHKMIAFAFNPQVVIDYLARAGALHEWEQEYGLEGLEPDPECWECTRA